MYRPPVVVRRLLEAVYWLYVAPRLRGRAPTQKVPWVKIVMLLNTPGFTEGIMRYDVKALLKSPQVVQHVWENYFSPDAAGGPLKLGSVRYASEAAAVLFQWAASLMDEVRREPERPPPQDLRLPVLNSPLWATPCSRPSARGRLPSGPRSPPSPSAPSLSSSCPSLPPAYSMASTARPYSPGKQPKRPLSRSSSTSDLPKLSLSASEVVLLEPSPSQPSTPCLRTIAIVAGTCRKMTTRLAKAMYNWPNTLVLVFVHDKEAHSRMRAEAAKLTANGDHTRFKVELLELDNLELAVDSASMAMARYPTIKGLIIDAKALPEAQPRQGQERSSPVGRAMRSAAVAFNALRPYFAAGMRLLVVTSCQGLQAGALIGQERRAALFQDPNLQVSDLEDLVDTFTAELAAAKKKLVLLPCRSPSGLWLDVEGFGYVLLHALLCIWQRQNMFLSICACACHKAWGENPLEIEEQETVTQVMSDAGLTFANVNQRLYGNKAEVLPWFSDDADTF